MRRKSLRAEAPVVPGPRMLRHGLQANLTLSRLVSLLFAPRLLLQHDQFTYGSASLADSNWLACSSAGDRPGWSSGPQLRWRRCSQWPRDRDRAEICVQALHFSASRNRADFALTIFTIPMVSQTRIRCSQGLLPRRKSCSCFFLLISHPSMRVTEAVEGAKKRAELKASKPALGPQRGIARARERRGRRYCFTLLEPPDLATFTSPRIM